MRLLSIASIALVAACSSSSSAPSQQVVGNTGGEISVEDGSSVKIPEGAVTKETTISITPVANPVAPANTTIVGAAYVFEPEGATFAMPVRIALAVDTALIPAGKTINDVKMFTAPKGSTEYTALGTTVEDGKVSASTSHFSIFVPAIPKPPVSSCVASCVTRTGECTCTATCNDQTYQMICYDGEVCKCGERFVSGHPRCNDAAGLIAVWKDTSAAGCGYPGTIGAN